MLVPEDATEDKSKNKAAPPSTQCDQSKTLQLTHRENDIVIRSSDSFVSLSMRHPAKMAELEKGDLFLFFARHCCRQHSRFAGNFRVAVRAAQNTASSAVPTTANARRLKCTKCGAVRSP